MNPPNDLDTTSLALQLVPQKDTQVHMLLDEMLEYLSPDGLIQVQPFHSIEKPETDYI